MFARVPITVDAYGVEDVAVTTVLAGLFPIANYDLIHTNLINVTGKGGKQRTVLVVVAQAIT